MCIYAYVYVYMYGGCKATLRRPESCEEREREKRKESENESKSVKGGRERD